jgi:hypothetical protein
VYQPEAEACEANISAIQGIEVPVGGAPKGNNPSRGPEPNDPSTFGPTLTNIRMRVLEAAGYCVIVTGTVFEIASGLLNQNIDLVLIGLSVHWLRAPIHFTAAISLVLTLSCQRSMDLKVELRLKELKAQTA